MTRMTYPSGRIVNYELDALGRVQAITTQANGASPVQTVASDLGYLPFGPADHWIDGNGVATNISYDEDYRVTAIDAHGASDILSLGYTYNDNSNITGILDKLGIDSQQFGYDKLNRLTSADGQYGAIDYAYDGVGDRTRRTMTKDSATTEEDYRYESGSHRLAAVTATDASGTTERRFSHDANGNTTSDASNDRVLQLAFNARNRLAEVTQGGNVVGQYEYNALGQRVAKTSTYRGRLHAHIDQGNKPGKNSGKGNASQSNVHATTDNAPVTEHLQFVYDEHGNLIAESDGEGNVVREYIYLGNTRIAMTASTLDHPEVTPSNAVISTGSGAATGAERPQPTTLSLYFIHNDHLGTPKVVTDQNQNIVWSLHQTPFGETTLDTEAIRMPMRFPGQYADIESGYRYNYFRDYDPSLGRYVESDPIGLVGGANSFVYVGDRPLQYIDSSGEVPLIVIIPIVGGLVDMLYQGYVEAGKGNSTRQSLYAAEARGFASGFSGTLTAMIVGTATKRASLASASGALVANLVNQAILNAGLPKDPASALASTIVGAILGPLSERMVPTRGFLPKLLKLRNAKNFGPNSQHLVTREGVASALGVTVSFTISLSCD